MRRQIPDFTTLIRRVRAGDGQADSQLFREYDGSFRRALRRALNAWRRLRSLNDTVDFTLLAWEEFFRRRAEWREIETPSQLLVILMTIGEHRIHDEGRRFDRQRRGCPQVSLDGPEAQNIPDCGVSPADLAACRDQIDAVLKRRPPLHREIVDLHGKGHTCDEIARIVGRTAGQVRRVLKEIEVELTG